MGGEARPVVSGPLPRKRRHRPHDGQVPHEEGSRQGRRRDRHRYPARVFIDSKDSRVMLAEWAGMWRQSHRVAPSTQATYDNHLDNHIIPAFGDSTLEGIVRLAVKQWANR